jgi:hypothetical protein
MDEVRQRIKTILGFTLDVQPSGINHKDAGLGVWLQGAAKAGAVVALYPGVVYTPKNVRHMPNYPKVDRDNQVRSCPLFRLIV